jgi:hypothetical protein
MIIRSQKTKQLLQKSRESALLAVDIYNKPATQFRSYGYIVLMNIAWTSLLHAIFEKKRITYYYKDTVIDGEFKAWDISKCIQRYYKEVDSPVRKNLEFFIELRNKIEHRFLPALDLAILGECQSFLINYEKLLVECFGGEYSISTSLAIPLQLLSVNPTWKTKVLKELQAKQYQIVKNYIDTYRAALDNTTLNDPEYSFRVFLIPKIGNHEQSSEIAIEFIKFDPDHPDEMEKHKHEVTLIRETTVRIPIVNLGMFKSGEVTKRVNDAINRKLHAASHHAKCWRYFNVRPEKNSKNPDKTNRKYCHWDEPHKDYVYTQEWIDLLISELSNPQKRLTILGKEPKLLNPE